MGDITNVGWPVAHVIIDSIYIVYLSRGGGGGGNSGVIVVRVCGPNF